MSVSLQDFMQMREIASNRMADPQARAQAARTQSSAPAWQKVLEAKKAEIDGQWAAKTQAATRTPAASPVRIPSGSLPPEQTRQLAEQLKVQMRQGLPVRPVGNFVDLRA